jgi:rubrerythrin
MSFDFNADEIFEMAEQIEQNGAKFYRNSAEGINEPSSRQFLSDLAAMEDGHVKIFASMRAGLTESERTSTTFDPGNEAVLYLHALADSRVFLEKQIPDIQSLANRPENEILEKILKFAIGAEKESIIFYLGMKDVVPENLGKHRLDAIIKEEMGHIRMLSNKLVSIKKGEAP